MKNIFKILTLACFILSMESKADLFLSDSNTEECLKDSKISNQLQLNQEYKVLYYKYRGFKDVGWMESEFDTSFILERGAEEQKEVIRVSINYLLGIGGLDCSLSRNEIIRDESEIEKIYKTYELVKDGQLDL